MGAAEALETEVVEGGEEDDNPLVLTQVTGPLVARRRFRGRETKLTPAVRERILKLIRAGNYMETACAEGGISSRQLRDLIRKGRIALDEGRRTPYGKFVEDLEQAQAAAESAIVLNIREQLKKDWKAGKWWLETTRPATWGRTQRLDVRVEDVTAERLAMLQAMLMAKGSEDE